MQAATVKDRPILLGAPWVKLILAGRKTQTRRVVKWPKNLWFDEGGYPFVGPGYADCRPVEAQDIISNIACPFGEAGDRLWVRETWAPYWRSSQPATIGEATYACFPDGSQKFKNGGYYQETIPGPPNWPSSTRWKPSIHMPRWVSRINLEITEVRVERLQSISASDAKAEGVSSGLIPATGDHPDLVGYMVGKDDGVSPLHSTRAKAFAEAWDQLGAHESCRWAANPWVWVVSFRRIDAVAK